MQVRSGGFPARAFVGRHPLAEKTCHARAARARVTREERALGRDGLNARGEGRAGHRGGGRREGAAGDVVGQQGEAEALLGRLEPQQARGDLRGVKVRGSGGCEAQGQG